MLHYLRMKHGQLFSTNMLESQLIFVYRDAGFYGECLAVELDYTYYISYVHLEDSPVRCIEVSINAGSTVKKQGWSRGETQRSQTLSL